MINKDQDQRKVGKKINAFESVYACYKGRKLTGNSSKSEIFPIKSTQGKWINILTPKQMVQRLPISLAQVNAGSISENLLNQIRKIINFLNREKEITKNVHNNKNE